jgi:hypothetical protein
LLKTFYLTIHSSVIPPQFCPSFFSPYFCLLAILGANKEEPRRRRLPPWRICSGGWCVWREGEAGARTGRRSQRYRRRWMRCRWATECASSSASPPGCTGSPSTSPRPRTSSRSRIKHSQVRTLLYVRPRPARRNVDDLLYCCCYI